MLMDRLRENFPQRSGMDHCLMNLRSLIQVCSYKYASKLFAAYMGILPTLSQDHISYRRVNLLKLRTLFQAVGRFQNEQLSIAQSSIFLSKLDFLVNYTVHSFSRNTFRSSTHKSSRCSPPPPILHIYTSATDGSFSTSREVRHPSAVSLIMPDFKRKA